MTKISMVNLCKKVLCLIQIRRTGRISRESEQAGKIIEIMEQAVKLEVPNKVDYEKGKNWGR